MQFLLISLRTNVIFLHKNKLNIVQRVQLLTGRRPMRSFSLAAVATIALWKSEPMLVPAKRDVQLMTRLRRARQYPTIYARTNRYKNSFILFGLNHFQCCDFVYFVYA